MQSLLWQNRAGLAEQGCFLVGDRLRIDKANTIDWPLWYLDAAGRNPVRVEEDLAERLPQLRDCEALVLSAENLALPETAQAILPLVERFETSIIYYVRRQDHFLLSSWRQWGMKRGITLAQHILRRVAEGKPDFPGTLAMWSRHVPAERMHVRFIDPPWLDGGDLGSDLFGALGYRADDLTPPAATNPSPDRAVLMFLARHKELFASVHDDAPVEILQRADSGVPRRLQLDRHVQRSLKLVYDPSNVDLCQRYMGRADGAEVIAIDGPEAAADHVTPEDLARLRALLPKVHEPGLAAALAADLARGLAD